jgi:hypothetical protein
MGDWNSQKTDTPYLKPDEVELAKLSIAATKSGTQSNCPTEEFPNSSVWRRPPKGCRHFKALTNFIDRKSPVSHQS